MGGGGVLNLHVRGDLPHIKLRAGMSRMKLWGRVPGRGNSVSEGRVQGLRLNELRASGNRKEDTVAGAQ